MQLATWYDSKMSEERASRNYPPICQLGPNNKQNKTKREVRTTKLDSAFPGIFFWWGVVVF